MTFKLEKIANMIFLSTEDMVWEAWEETEFTERKLKNRWKRIESNLCGNCVLVRTF